MVDRVALDGRMGMRAMEEGVEAEGEASSREAEGQISMRAALVEQPVMVMGQARVLIKVTMCSLMVFFEPGRVDHMLAGTTAISKVTTTGQMLGANLGTMVTSMLEDLFQIIMQISCLPMGVVGMLPMSQV
jgi:hypothetical protein